jgi:ribosome-associated toxin RatA of RatAB toxin-antitoxin module
VLRYRLVKVLPAIIERRPMPEVVNSAVIRAPADDIFAFISHAERNVEWVPDLERSERLTPGETRLGTRFRFLSKLAGIPVDVTDEVVQVDPGRYIAFRGVTGPPHSGSWRFEPLGDGSETQVTYSMEFELPPAIGPLVAKLIRLEERLDAQSRACLVNLRRLLER